jgi:hypothetical protein
VNLSKFRPYNDPQAYGFALGWAVVGPVAAVVSLFTSCPWLAPVFAVGAVFGALYVRDEWQATRRQHPDAVTRPWGWHKRPLTEAVDATILVDDWSCYCSHCDGVTTPEAFTHTGPEGCGARFTAISAKDYVFPHELLQQLRPDLTVV